MKKTYLGILIGMSFALAVPARTVVAQVETLNSGGPLMAEQAAYDVTFYDLSLAVNPADSSITGQVRTVATVFSPITHFVLDLDTLLTVYAVARTETRDQPLAFEHKDGKIWIDLAGTAQPGDILDLIVSYGGKPRIAPNPPWDGGFTWARTESGAPWIATSCQGEGADVWWPLKEHVSDKPDSVGIHITVPNPLVVATNGRMQSVEKHSDGTSTYNWFVSTPINTYNVALNIAPYELIEGELESVAGDTFPIQFFVLPEDLEKGKQFFPEILDHLRFFEEYLGPYPFRADKYGVAQTPHLGMEHQTIIAYGAKFSNTSMTRGNDLGFDALHHHELSHEWWGNLVTNVGWNDMWLHEGFGSYMQPLYVEYLAGHDAYLKAFARGHKFQNRIPVAPREIMSSAEIYGGDIYGKGSWILHTLRYLIGDEAFFKTLRRMAYPTPEMERITSGEQTRFVVTDDYLRIVNSISGLDVSWFFEVYLRQPDLPRIEVVRDGPEIELTWNVPHDLPFPMPVDVEIDGARQRVEMENGSARLDVGENATVVVDPDNLVLRVGNRSD